MDFSFNAKTFRDLYHNTVADFLEGEAEESENENSPYNLLSGMDQAIDVMARSEADSVVQKEMSSESIGLLEAKDITQIGQFSNDLLEAMVSFVQTKTGEQNRDLLRLSIPLALWVARHGGRLTQIDMLVNSLAGYANEISQQQLLVELVGVLKEIIDACSDGIRRDIEQTNMMRSWRVLNLNYGIVATRSHQPELIEQAYDALVKNLPQDARQFFKEGLEQMDVVGYPEEVRTVVERYNNMWGAKSVLH